MKQEIRDKINDAVVRRDGEKNERMRRLQDEEMRLRGEICLLSERVKELVDTANYLVRCGLVIVKPKDALGVTPRRYCTDGVYHEFGFFCKGVYDCRSYAQTRIEGIGRDGSGASPYELRYDGVTLTCTSSGADFYAAERRIELLRDFIREFPKLEKAIYDEIDAL